MNLNFQVSDMIAQVLTGITTYPMLVKAQCAPAGHAVAGFVYKFRVTV